MGYKKKLAKYAYQSAIWVNYAKKHKKYFIYFI